MSFKLTTEDGLTVIETACIGRCTKLHRVDSRHPEFERVKAALERGDRSEIFCYHKHSI